MSRPGPDRSFYAAAPVGVAAYVIAFICVIGVVPSVAADDAARAIAALAAQGIAAAAIGTVVEGPPQVYAESEDGPMPVPLFERDELTRVFATIP